MSYHKMFFGTRERMTWINCPAVDMGLSQGRWSTNGVFLSGGAYLRRSMTGHKIYDMSWNMTTQEAIYEIVNYDQGVYGDGLIYFYEPFAMNTNVFPQFWATPRLARQDGPSLVLGRRPDVVTAVPNNLGFPTRSAFYTLREDDEFAELWLPVPDGYTLHIGVKGSATDTAAVTVLPDGEENADALTPIFTGNTTLTNAMYSGVTGVTVSLGGEGNLTLNSMIAQVLPSGVPAPNGAFPGGRGHSGCRFEAPVDVTGFSAALDLVSASATLIETGAWETQ